MTDGCLVIAIESLAGSGKTTLSRTLLDDPEHRYARASALPFPGEDDAAPLCIDDIPADGAARSLAGDLVVRRHARGLRTIVAGRSGVRALVASIPPGDVTVVTFADLRLTTAHVTSRFLAAGAAQPHADDLAHRCAGWAVAVAFVERRLHEGIAPSALARVDGAWQSLWTYAQHHVLDALDDAALADLAAVVCTHGATISDFASEQHCSLFAARERLEGLPFVEIDERGSVRVWPLALPLMRSCRPSHLVTCARALAAARPASAAIATLLRGGDLEGAAQRAEASIELVPALDPESSLLLAELPQSILRSHPRLWLGVGMPRWWHDDTAELIEGAAFALDAASPSDIDTRYGLTLMIFPALIASGQRERARALVDRLLRDAWAAPAPHHPILAALLEAAWFTFDERDFDIDTVRDACTPLFGNPGTYFVYLVMPLWTWYRIHGRPDEALEVCEKGIAVSRELMPGSYADALQGAAYTAWLAGNDTRLGELLALAREAITAHRLERSHGFFSLAAAGEPDSDRLRDRARPWAIAEGLLMRAALRDSAEAARRDVIEAISIADRIGFREMVLTGRVALAVIDDAARFDHLAEAARVAQQIGTRELIEAVDALAISNARDGKSYQPILRRFERFRAPLFRLSLGTGTIENGCEQIAVSRQQFAILSLIALAERPIPRRELSELVTSSGSLIPERVLEVQLARLRKKLGASVIVHDGDGYRFGIPYTTDWHEALRALAVVHDRRAAEGPLDAIAAHIAREFARAPDLGPAHVRIADAMRR